MSAPLIIPTDVIVVGQLTSQSMALPSGCIADSQIQAGANVDASKLIHRHGLSYRQAPSANVVADTVDLYVARAAGTLISFEAALTGVIPSGDRTVTLDMQKSTGGGAFATVLSATLVLDSANTIRVLEAGTITTTAFVDGDLLRLTVAVAGSTGTQPQGLVVMLNLDEKPQ